MNSSVLAIDANDVLIRAQETPNPLAMKFVVNFPLKREGKATFQSSNEAAGFPLVASLFEIPGVTQVYLFQNTLTLTHSGELPASIVKDQVSAVLKTRAAVHSPDFTAPDEAPLKAAKPDRSHLSPVRMQIEEILDRTIRPGLQADGGDIEVIDFENNVLKILYQGACGGCPSSMMGTLDAIQGILSQELDNPELSVVPL